MASGPKLILLMYLLGANATVIHFTDESSPLSERASEQDHGLKGM